MSRKPSDSAAVNGAAACGDTEDTVDGGVTATELTVDSPSGPPAVVDADDDCEDDVVDGLLALCLALPLLFSSDSAGGVSGVYQPPCDGCDAEPGAEEATPVDAGGVVDCIW